MKARINVTIDSELHEAAKAHAKAVHHTSFSGLVVKLVVADIAKSSAAGELSREAKRRTLLPKSDSVGQTVRRSKD